MIASEYASASPRERTLLRVMLAITLGLLGWALYHRAFLGDLRTASTGFLLLSAALASQAVIPFSRTQPVRWGLALATLALLALSFAAR